MRMHLLFYIILFLLSTSAAAQTLSFVNYTTDDGLPSNSIQSIYQDQRGYIWLGTDRGISRFNGVEFEPFYSDNTNNSTITYFYEDTSKKLYFLTNKNETFYFLNDSIYKSKESAVIKAFKKNRQINNPTIEAYLKEKQIIQVLVDKENSVWIATQEHGLFYFPFYPNLKKSYPSLITSAISTSKKAVYIARKDSVVLCSENNLEPIATEIKYIPSLKNGLVFENKALYFNGVFVYHFDKEILNISKEAAPYLLINHNQFIYIYDRRATVYKVNITDRTHQTIDITDTPGLTSLGLDQQGNLWGGYQDQLIKISDSIKTIDSPLVINGKPLFMKGSKYFDLIIATQNNGLLFKKKDSIFSITSFDLNNSKINDLYVDDTQSLWVSTNSGLFVMRNNDVNSIKKLTTKNGLLSNNVNSVTRFKNQLYVATKKGLSIIEPFSLIKNKPAQVLFPYLKLDNEKIFPSTSKITVDSKYSYLTIQYLALNYKSKGDITYRYKIRDIHKDWVVTTDTQKQFTFLPDGGDYFFEIMAQNEDGMWGPPSLIEFEFLIPFYKTWWFYTFFSVLFVGVLLLTLFYFYKRKLKIQSFKTELLQLESKALQSQMNQHFVFNSLNAIQSFIATGDILNSEIYLAKFSKLLRLTLNNSSVASCSLSKEIEHLGLYLSLEKLRFGQKLTYTISVEKELEEDLIQIPPMLIQPFVENAILHGITPKKEGGMVHIEISHQSDKALECIIEDSGIGRQKNKNKLHISLGTDIVLKRLALLSNNTIRKIDYTDLKDDRGNSNGTKVTFLIPIYD